MDNEAPVGEQDVVQFLVRVPRELRDAFDAIARSRHTRRAEAIREIMREYVACHQDALVALLKEVSNG